VKGIAGLEAAAQKFPRLGLGCCGINGHPFGRELMPALEAPIRIIPRDPFPDALVADFLEQPPADHLADFGFVIGEEVACDTAHNPSDPLLPQQIRIGHFYLAARQADHGSCSSRACRRHRQVLNEGMEAFGHAAVAVYEIEYFVEDEQRRLPPRHTGERPWVDLVEPLSVVVICLRPRPASMRRGSGFRNPEHTHRDPADPAIDRLSGVGH
jgi:hypothetical protein